MINLAPASGAVQNCREAWADCAKVIGITLVVYGHVARGVLNAGLPIEAGFFHLVDNVIYSFHMPLFFFIAGFFFVQSATRRGYGGLLRNKVDTIVYPYILWSLIQGGLEVALSSQTNSDIHMSEVLALFVMPRAHFWFLYVLFFTYVLAVLLYRKCSLGWAICICLFSVCMFFASEQLSDVYILHMLCRHFVFFSLGVLASNFPLRKPVGFFTVAMALIAFVPSQWIFNETLDFRFDSGPPAARLMIAVVGILLVVVLSRFLARLSLHWVNYVGRSSMVIFLIHIITGSGCRIVLQKVLGIDNVGVHLVFGTLAGLLGPLVLLRLSDRLKIRFLFEAPRRFKLDRVGT